MYFLYMCRMCLFMQISDAASWGNRTGGSVNWPNPSRAEPKPNRAESSRVEAYGGEVDSPRSSHDSRPALRRNKHHMCHPGKPSPAPSPSPSACCLVSQASVMC